VKNPKTDDRDKFLIMPADYPAADADGLNKANISVILLMETVNLFFRSLQDIEKLK
jgi:hypothetical protein